MANSSSRSPDQLEVAGSIQACLVDPSDPYHQIFKEAVLSLDIQLEAHLGHISCACSDLIIVLLRSAGHVHLMRFCGMRQYQHVNV